MSKVSPGRPPGERTRRFTARLHELSRLGVVLVLVGSGCGGGTSGDLPLVRLEPDQEIRRIAFGSCANQAAPQPIWNTVLDTKPDLFLFAGNAVYGEGGPKALARAYDAAAQVEGFRRLRSTTPVMAIWGDRDYGADDAGADYEHRDDSKKQFLEFWKVSPDSPRATREGLYHAEIIGPPGRRVQVVMLDTRSFRDPLQRSADPVEPGRGPYISHDDPSAELLGEVQFEWLIEQMEKPADLRIIVSDIQIAATQHGWEKWFNYPEDARRLFGIVEMTGAEHVVFLSGDRNSASMYRVGLGVPYPMHEVTSSSLNNPAPDQEEKDGNGIGEVHYVENFGLIEADWEDNSVSLELRGIDGTTLQKMKLDLDTLEAL